MSVRYVPGPGFDVFKLWMVAVCRAAEEPAV